MKDETRAMVIDHLHRCYQLLSLVDVDANDEDSSVCDLMMSKSLQDVIYDKTADFIIEVVRENEL